jgi:DNA repair protein RadC
MSQATCRKCPFGAEMLIMAENSTVSRSERLMRNLGNVRRILGVSLEEFSKESGIGESTQWKVEYQAGAGRFCGWRVLNAVHRMCKRQRLKIDEVIREAEGMRRERYLAREAEEQTL